MRCDIDLDIDLDLDKDPDMTVLTHHIEQIPPLHAPREESVVRKAHHLVGVLVIAIRDQEQLLAAVPLRDDGGGGGGGD